MNLQPLLVGNTAFSGPRTGPTPAAPRIASHEEIRLHLDERGFVPFHPVLAEKYGHKVAIFVGMSLYWTRHSLRNHPKREGWFHMSIQQWQQSIGMTRTEQATVRALLIGEGLLEENLIGRPAIMHYRLNVAALSKCLSIGKQGAVPNWETVSHWFRGCQNYYKPLADVVGSIAAGLYMSFVLQRHRDCVLRGQIDNGCIMVHQDEIATALNLGPKVQRNARDRLKRAGLIQETSPGGSQVRINMDALLMCLRGQATKPLKNKRGSKATPVEMGASQTNAPAVPAAVADCVSALVTGPLLAGLGSAFLQLSLALPGGSASAAKSRVNRPRDLLLDFLALGEPVGNRQVPIAHQGAAVTHIDSEKVKRDRELLRISALDIGMQSTPVKNAVSCKLDLPESAVSCKQELPFPATYIQGVNVLQTTTTLVRSSRSKNSHPKADPATLFISDKLSSSQRDSVLEVLTTVPEQERQPLLDELEGNLSNKAKAIQNPAGWLYGLIRNLADGPMVFAYADQVAADRTQRQELLKRQSTNDSAKPSLQPAPAQPNDMYSEEARAMRARLREKQNTGRAWRKEP